MADPEQPFLVVVDIYGNGYNNPPTDRAVQSLPVDPNNLPSVGDHIGVATVSGQGTNQQQKYALSGSGVAGLLAKVSNIAAAPTAYQVDIYGNGYTNPPTRTAVVAFPVDLAAANFALADQVSVFSAAGQMWIATSHPWTVVVPGTLIAAKITSHYSGGIYSFVEMTIPGSGGTVKPGGITGTATEINHSPNVSVNTFVFIKVYTDLNYYFEFSLGACS